MKGLHAVNGMLWAANACAWFLYTHSPVMGVLSTLACGLSFWYARNYDY